MERKNIVKINIPKNTHRKINHINKPTISNKEKFNCFQIYIIKLPDNNQDILSTLCDIHLALNKIQSFEATYDIEKNTILKNEKSGVVIDNDIPDSYVVYDIHQSINDEKSCHAKFYTNKEHYELVSEMYNTIYDLIS